MFQGVWRSPSCHQMLTLFITLAASHPAHRLNRVGAGGSAFSCFCPRTEQQGLEGGVATWQQSQSESSKEAGFSGLTLMMLKSPSEVGVATETEQVGGIGIDTIGREIDQSRPA